MLKTARDKRTCAKYRAVDKNGFVHCKECPLSLSNEMCMCKANAHYDRKTREWEFDDIEEEEHNE